MPPTPTTKPLVQSKPIAPTPKKAIEDAKPPAKPDKPTPATSRRPEAIPEGSVRKVQDVFETLHYEVSRKGPRPSKSCSAEAMANLDAEISRQVKALAELLVHRANLTVIDYGEAPATSGKSKK